MDLLFLTLQLLTLLSVSLSGDLKEHDALCGPGDSCYAVFYQRRPFLESWRACRDRGGNLATVKNVQEAALVEQLLTSSTGFRGAGDVQIRLWIGLQRQPRQCAPQKPLRGFTWTTGDQDTAFTNWVSQPVSSGSSGPCSASRCVAIGLGHGKPEDDFKWSEGSCTLPVDGYVCKFRYQGMCPTLTGENVRYSIPFGYQGPWLDLLPFGTVAVVSCESQQAVSVLCTFKEDRTVGWDKEEPVCQEDSEDLCQDCQQLCQGGVCACQEGYVLQPDGHSCEPEEFEEQRCPCQYRCIETGIGGKGYQCICPEGFELAADELSCEDIDECEDEETCDHSCQNTLGSFTCSCDLGFTVSDDDPERCVDIDECRFTRMCQQMCVNHLGGFECFCSEGYELDTDRMSCNRIDFGEPRNEPNLPVTSHETVFETETDTPGWEDLEDMDINSETEKYIPTFNEEMTTAEPTTEEIYETMTPPVGWETQEETTEVPTIMPVYTTASTIKQDAFTTTTLQTTSNVPSAHSNRFFPTTIPKEQSKVNVLSGEKETYDVATTKKPATSKSSWDILRLSTVVPSRSRVNENPQITLKTEKVATTTTVVTSGLPLANNDSHAVSPVHSNTPYASKESKGKRDTRWLIVALLVPLSVFLVIMLALGIVYCTRCGGEAKPRSVTDCYHWVTGSGPEKGIPPSGVDTPNGRGGV